MIYDIKLAYDFVCYIDFFFQQKEGKMFLHQIFLLVMVKHVSIFNIFISIFLHFILYSMKYHMLK